MYRVCNKTVGGMNWKHTKCIKNKQKCFKHVKNRITKVYTYIYIYIYIYIQYSEIYNINIYIYKHMLYIYMCILNIHMINMYMLIALRCICTVLRTVPTMCFLSALSSTKYFLYQVLSVTSAICIYIYRDVYHEEAPQGNRQGNILAQ